MGVMSDGDIIHHCSHQKFVTRAKAQTERNVFALLRICMLGFGVLLHDACIVFISTREIRFGELARMMYAG